MKRSLPSIRPVPSSHKVGLKRVLLAAEESGCAITQIAVTDLREKEFLAKAALVFTKESPDLSKEKEIHELHARIGQLDMMVDFLKKKL